MSITIKSLLHPVRQNEGQLHIIFMLFSSPGPLDRPQMDMKWSEARLMTAGMRCLSADTGIQMVCFIPSNHPCMRGEPETVFSGVSFTKPNTVPVLTTLSIVLLSDLLNIIRKEFNINDIMEVNKIGQQQLMQTAYAGLLIEKTCLTHIETPFTYCAMCK